MFAAIMMILIGGVPRLRGAVGLIDDTFYAVTPKYVLQFDATTWGWIHLVGGIVVLLAGFALFTGAVWARTVGVIIARSARWCRSRGCPVPDLGDHLHRVDVTVIWALTAHGRDIVMEG